MSSVPSQELRIRACRVEDAPALLRFWEQARAQVSVTDTIPDIEHAIRHQATHVLVAELDGRLVGSVIGGFDGWRANLYRLMVHPEHRRQGIARALVDEIERLLVQQGVKKIGAIVDRDHPWAVGFWEAAGYKLDVKMGRFVKLPRLPV